MLRLSFYILALSSAIICSAIDGFPRVLRKGYFPEATNEVQMFVRKEKLKWLAETVQSLRMGDPEKTLKFNIKTYLVDGHTTERYCIASMNKEICTEVRVSKKMKKGNPIKERHRRDQRGYEHEVDYQMPQKFSEPFEDKSRQNSAVLKHLPDSRTNRAPFDRIREILPHPRALGGLERLKESNRGEAHLHTPTNGDFSSDIGRGNFGSGPDAFGVPKVFHDSSRNRPVEFGDSSAFNSNDGAKPSMLPDKVPVSYDDQNFGKIKLEKSQNSPDVHFQPRYPESANPDFGRRPNNPDNRKQVGTGGHGAQHREFGTPVFAKPHQDQRIHLHLERNLNQNVPHKFSHVGSSDLNIPQQFPLNRPINPNIPKNDYFRFLDQKAPISNDNLRAENQNTLSKDDDRMKDWRPSNQFANNEHRNIERNESPVQLSDRNNFEKGLQSRGPNVQKGPINDPPPFSNVQSSLKSQSYFSKSDDDERSKTKESSFRDSTGESQVSKTKKMDSAEDIYNHLVGKRSVEYEDPGRKPISDRSGDFSKDVDDDRENGISDGNGDKSDFSENKNSFSMHELGEKADDVDLEHPNERLGRVGTNDFHEDSAKGKMNEQRNYQPNLHSQNEHSQRNYRLNLHSRNEDSQHHQSNFPSRYGESQSHQSNYPSRHGDNQNYQSNYPSRHGDIDIQKYHSNYPSRHGDRIDIQKYQSNYTSRNGDNQNYQSNYPSRNGDIQNYQSNYPSRHGDIQKYQSNYTSRNGDNQIHQLNSPYRHGDNQNYQSNYPSRHGDIQNYQSNYPSRHGDIDIQKYQSNYTSRNGYNQNHQLNSPSRHGYIQNYQSNYPSRQGDIQKYQSNYTSRNGFNQNHQLNSPSHHGDNQNHQSNSPSRNENRPNYHSNSPSRQGEENYQSNFHSRQEDGQRKYGSKVELPNEDYQGNYQTNLHTRNNNGVNSKNGDNLEKHKPDRTFARGHPPDSYSQTKDDKEYYEPDLQDSKKGSVDGLENFKKPSLSMKNKQKSFETDPIEAFETPKSPSRGRADSMSEEEEHQRLMKEKFDEFHFGQKGKDDPKEDDFLKKGKLNTLIPLLHESEPFVEDDEDINAPGEDEPEMEPLVKKGHLDDYDSISPHDEYDGPDFSPVYGSRLRRGAAVQNDTRWNEGKDFHLCRLPKPSKTYEAFCKVLLKEARCNLYCIRGFTFPEGIMKKTTCSKYTGKWTTRFDECKPFVDCSLRLRSAGLLSCEASSLFGSRTCNVSCGRVGLRPEVQATAYECSANGTWSPPLPHCVDSDGISLAPKPALMELKEIKYP